MRRGETAPAGPILPGWLGGLLRLAAVCAGVYVATSGFHVPESKQADVPPPRERAPSGAPHPVGGLVQLKADREEDLKRQREQYSFLKKEIAALERRKNRHNGEGRQVMAGPNEPADNTAPPQTPEEMQAEIARMLKKLEKNGIDVPDLPDIPELDEYSQLDPDDIVTEQELRELPPEQRAQFIHQKTQETTKELGQNWKQELEAKIRARFEQIDNEVERARAGEGPSN